MTLKELLDRAASECIDKRESYLVVFTTGLNGYVCLNEGSTHESRALFHGTYRECQIWIERRGVSAAIDYVLAHMEKVPEITQGGLSETGVLKAIAQLPDKLSPA